MSKSDPFSISSTPNSRRGTASRPSNPTRALKAALLGELARRQGGGAPAQADNPLQRYATDPVGFVQDVLGEHLWSRQRVIAEAVRDHRRVAVPSCHGAGKSFLAARIAAWWIATSPPGDGFVVTSAPTFAQVRAILWREINRAHRRGKLPGRINQTEWHLGKELVAFGRKPNDMDMTAFQGIHARRVLVIFDEACGIPKPLWDAAETLVTNDESRLFAIGNPDDPTSEFAAVCKPGSGFHVLPIDALATPNLTDEPLPEAVKPLLVSRRWVDEMRQRWGEGTPLWTAKIRGQFPEAADDSLLPLSLLHAASERPPDPANPADTDTPAYLGVDVARFGEDETVVMLRRGAQVTLCCATRKEDTMRTTGRIVDILRSTGAVAVRVDDAGVGGGVTDRLRELGLPVQPVNGGSSPRDKDRFLNLRAELFWSLREALTEGRLALPKDDRLLGQLAALRYAIDSRGRIRIEGKEEMRKRGLPSPDRADALALCFAVDPDPTPTLTPRLRML